MLGAVQGLTEFVPISSSGHLVLVPEALGWAPPGLAFDVTLHVASLIALVTYFAKDLWQVAHGLRTGDRAARRLVVMLAIATVPAVIAGFTLSSYFEGTFTDARSAAIQLVITAVILVAAERILLRNQRTSGRLRGKLRNMDDVNALDATLIGIAQAISILPGISRSGSTIAAGLALGISRDDSARFAFLLAVPALAGAALVEIPSMGAGDLTAGATVAGFLSSLVFSYVAIAGLLRYLRNNTLYPFAVYCVVAGVLFYLVV
ncbi:MAG: undecaprenyl-diphosphate phosphatase [Actinobacteria bacterium]|nr:undecaprenyl-diphosphate phosphatase [Actinomycetota bacterium]